MSEPRVPRILFLCHSASRNGATLLLLDFLQWLKMRVEWEMEVLIDGPGPLVEDFRAVATTFVLRNPAALVNVLPRNLRPSAQRSFKKHYMRLLLSGRRFDLIYANTSATWPHVESLAKRTPAVFWHIHEMAYALRLSMGEGRIRQCLDSATRVVAVSHGVRDTLVQEFGVRADKIDVVHGFVPTTCPAERNSRRERVRRELGWPEDAFVVGGCGALGWRKGTDVFVQAARAMAAATGYERVRFLWVGGSPHEKESLEFTQDVRALGLQAHCKLIPTTPEVSDYFCAMDAFALTSREDPFPLVMLEAAVHGLPIVCFAGSGGGPELVGSEAGLIAPYLDVDRFVSHIKTLYNEPAIREHLGETARQRVKLNHGVDLQATKLLQIMDSCLRQAPGSRSYAPRSEAAKPRHQT